MFYIMLFLTLIILLFFSSYYKGRYNIFILLFFIIIFLVPGLRGDVGQDTHNYMVHYQRLQSFSSFVAMISDKEPILYFIMYPHKLIVNNYTNFLVIIALLQSYLLYYSTKRLYHRSFFLLFYIFIFFFELHFNVLRVGLAILFFLCALSEMHYNNKKSILFLLLSVLSHLSIIIVFPILAVRAKASFKQYVILGILLTIFSTAIYFLYADVIIFKFEAYDLTNFSNMRLPRLVTAVLTIAWVSYIFSSNISNQVKISLIIFSLFILYSGVSPIAHRFFMIALAVLLYIVSEQKIMNFSKLKFRYFFIGFLSILALSSYNVIYGVIAEPTRRMQPGASGNSDFNYHPYSLFYESKYR